MKIDKNIPVPPAPPKTLVETIRETMSQMSAGDSVFVPIEIGWFTGSIVMAARLDCTASFIHLAAKQIGINVRCKNEEKGVRFWKL